MDFSLNRRFVLILFIQYIAQYRVKPGLHIVVTVAEHACDHVLKRALKLSTHRLQIFLVKYEYLPSLQLCRDQGVS